MSMYPGPSGYPPPPRRGSDVDPLGLFILAFAGFSIWRFGLWWGLGIAAAGFVVVVFVGVVNVAGTTQKHRSSRGPLLAQVHAFATSLLSFLLGFGVAASVVPGASGDAVGIVAAAGVLTVLGEIVGRILDLDWSGARGSWCLLLLVSFPVSVPVAAWIAPHYRLAGVGANVATILLVLASTTVVWQASPWRNHWRSPPD